MFQSRDIFSVKIVRLLPETGTCSDSPGLEETFDDCIQVKERNIQTFQRGLVRPSFTRWWWRTLPGAQFLGWQTGPTFAGLRRTERKPLTSIRQTGGTRITSVLIPAPSPTCTSGPPWPESPTPTESSFFTSRRASKWHPNFKDTQRCLWLQK